MFESVVTAADERKRKLHVLLESEGWRDVMAPALRREIESRQRRLEVTDFESVAEVAGLQEQIRLLRKLLEDPRRFVNVEAL